MKILMVIPTIFPGDRGSPARAFEMINALSDKGINVEVVCYKNNIERKSPAHCKIYSIPMLGFYKVGIGPSYSRIILDFFLLFRVYLLCLTRKIDILHCHLHEGALIGLIAGRIFHIKVVFDIHSLLGNELIEQKFIVENGFVKKIINYLDKKLPQWVDYNITVGENLVDYYKNLYPNIKIEKVSNVTNTEFFKPGICKMRGELGIEEKTVIGYQGNMSPMQNLILFVETAEIILKKVSNVKFLIGYTSNPENIKDIVKQKKLESEFLFIPSPYAKAPEIINCCDIMIVPRMDSFGFPMKVLNFMACGKPVLASKDVAKNLFNRETKLDLYCFDNKDELVEIVLSMIGDKNLRKERKDATIKFIHDEFSHHSLSLKLIRIYNELLKENKPIISPLPVRNVQ